MTEGHEFAARIRLVREPLLALSRRVAAHPQDGEDILQSALAAAYQARAAYEPAHPFAAWIAGFVIRCGRNQNRKRRPLAWSSGFECRLDAQLAQEFSYEAVLVDPEAALERVGDRLFRAVKSLPCKEREIFLLRAVMDLSYKDISAACSVPIGTVMSRLHRARTALRRNLALEEARR